MANNNSTQYTNMTTYRDTSNSTGGRLRRNYWSCTIPTGSADTMTFTKLPKGARVMGGGVQCSAAQGATATMAIGISGTTGKYRAAALNNGTTMLTFGLTPTENFGTETTAEETIIATNAAAAWTAGTCVGYIDYVVD